MTGARRTAALAVALPLALAGLVVAASAALAAPVAPGNGTVFTAPASFEVRADYGPSSEENRLSLTSPSGEAQVVATAGGGLGSGTLTYRFDTGCWTYPSSSCTGRRPAPNGTWTVTQNGGGAGSSTFVTRIPPAAPTGVSAVALSPREVRLTWARGAEPDLVRWTVLEGSAVVQDGVGLDACSGDTCSTVVRYASEGSGDHTYAVRAHRTTAPGSSETLASPSSATTSARLEPAPAAPSDPTPAPAGSGTGDGGSGPGSTGDGGTTGGAAPGTGGAPAPGEATTTGAGVGPGAGGGTPPPAGGDIPSRRASAPGFSTFGPQLGTLPALPQAPAPAIAPDPGDGTFEGTLGFEDQVLTERVEVAQGPTGRVASAVGEALDGERLATSTAGALVLLLSGAHLRRWLGIAPQD